MEPLGILRMAKTLYLKDEIGTLKNWLQLVADNSAKLILNSRALLYDGGGRRELSFLETRRPWLGHKYRNCCRFKRTLRTCCLD